MNKYSKKINFISLFIAFNILTLTLSCDNEQKQSIHTPDWSKGAVWYQIFPERFRNGNQNNDPTILEVMGNDTSGWKISPWTAGWYTMPNWEKRMSTSFYTGVYHRRYGGDLEGVIEKLDYLLELGVTAIYFNPIFEAQSLHKYDASSFHHIDNNFGRDREGDALLMQNELKHSTSWAWSSADSIFLELIQEAHSRNIKVIIDGVFNHVGRDFWAFKDVLKNGKQSRYANWFIIKKWDDPNTVEDEMDYSGWWGHKSLPEFQEDENGIIPEVKEYIWGITKRWMDPNGDGDFTDGVDGWRLDAVPDVSKVFWKEWCTFTRTINPEIYLVAETWYEAQEYLSNEIFNATMNYPFAKATVNFFIDKNRSIPASVFITKLNHLLNIYPWDVTLSTMTLINSHDTDRLANMIINPDRPYDTNSTPKDSADYAVRKPNDEELKIQIMIAAFQASFPGSPLIYYGDEAGMWGADDPDDRKPMVWEDIEYDDEEYKSLGKDYPSDEVSFNKDLNTIYKTLFSTRKNSNALKLGVFNTELIDDPNKLFGFSRTYGEDSVYAYFNRGDKSARIPLKTSTDYTDILGHSIEKNESGNILILAGKSAAILIGQK